MVESDTSIDIAEKMCLQFLQQLGAIRAEQEALKTQAPEENKVKTFTEQPHVEC